MSRRIDMRTVIERFASLKRAADRHAKNTVGGNHSYDVDLHDTAIRRAARKGRDR